MEILLYIILILFVFILLFKKKKSSGRCILILGKKGKGKSVSAVQIAIKNYYKKGQQVYSSSTLPIYNAIRLEKDFFNYKYPRGSLLILDEGHIDWDSRDFKKTPLRLRKFLGYLRHYGIDLIVITQYSDGIEKLFKAAADEIWDLRSLIRLTGRKISLFKRYEDIIQYQKYIDGKETAKARIGLRIIKNKYFGYYDSYIIDEEYEASPVHPDSKFNTELNTKAAKLKRFIIKSYNYIILKLALKKLTWTFFATAKKVHVSEC